MAFHQHQQQSQLLSSPQHVSDSEPERETARRERSRARSPLSLNGSPSPSPVQHSKAGSSKFASASALSPKARVLKDARHQDDHSPEDPSASESFSTRHSVTPITPPRPHQSQKEQQQTRDSPATLSSDQSTSEASPGTSFGQHLKAKFSYNSSNGNRLLAAQPAPKPLHAATNFFKSRSVSPAAPAAKPFREITTSTDAPKQDSSKKQPRGKNAVDPAVTNIIPLGLMGLLSDCPVCKLVWTAKKSAAVKLNHISSCAQQQGYDLDTVRVLIEQRLKTMQEAEEQQKAQKELDKSLFDQVVGGAAQGVLRGGKKAQVQVVGRDAEAVAATQGGTLHEHVSSTQVSREISRAAKQPKSNFEKKIRSAVKLLESTKTPAEAASAQSSTSTSASNSNNKSKKAPGRLQSYSQTKDRLAHKAQTMMDDITAASASNTVPSLSVQNVSNSNLSRGVKSSSTQLSLQNLQQVGVRRQESAPHRPLVSQRRVIEIDMDSDQELDEAAAEEEVELPSTQPLEPSTLVQPLDAGKDQSAASANAGMWAFASSRQEDEVQESAFDAILPSPHSSSIASVPPLTSLSRTAPSRGQLLSSAPRPHLSSPSAARAFSSTVQAPSEATTSTELSPPDYASWSVEELKAEAQKYGYKPPGTKVACINLLTRIWNMLNRKAAAAESAPTTPAPKKSATASSSSQASKAAPAPAQNEEAESETAGKQKKTRAKSRKQAKTPRVSAASMADAGEDLGAEDTDDVDIGFEESMRRLIRRDEELWSKLLRYQPVSFETFDRMATANNLKHTAIGLRRFLDSQSIAFFMEGPHQDRTRGGQKYAPAKKKTTTTSKKKNTTS